jgi:hypothetical protein
LNRKHFLKLTPQTANDRTVHADFYRDFGDLFDDADLN